MTEDRLPPIDYCRLQRRSDGAVLVSVPSRPNHGHTLPDAVFAFRAGDPQFSYWDAKLREQGSTIGLGGPPRASIQAA